MALVIAAIAGAVTALRFIRVAWHPSDFGQAWFAAAALRHGGNPYALVGPGLQYEWPWRLFYPATTMVVALPFSFFSELAATTAFVAISTGLLAYGVTRDGWYRLPLFLSYPLVLAVLVAQWSPIIAAAACLPALGWILWAKPNLGVAVFVASESVRLFLVAVVGGLLLIAASLALFPSWPHEWLHSMRMQSHIGAPITRLGGPLILLGLLRWRRPEARLIVALACLPQTSSWYEAVPLFLVPATFRESLALALVSALGYFLPPHVMTARNEVEFNQQMGSLMVAICYLPATLLVLRRPNVGELPAWAKLIASKFPGRTARGP